MFYILIIIIIIIIVIITYYKYNNKPLNNDSLIIISIIKEKIKRLINHSLLDINNDYYKYIKKINNKIDDIDISENNLNNKSTSYTINKGEKMILCLRSKIDYKMHNINNIMYVVIHELAHIGCPEIGHTLLFTKINKYLLKKAIECKEYIYVNYKLEPTEYCGLDLNNNVIDN
jgi:predicted metal-dependent hydrolase